MINSKTRLIFFAWILPLCALLREDQSWRDMHQGWILESHRSHSFSNLGGTSTTRRLKTISTSPRVYVLVMGKGGRWNRRLETRTPNANCQWKGRSQITNGQGIKKRECMCGRALSFGILHIAKNVSKLLPSHNCPMARWQTIYDEWFKYNTINLCVQRAYSHTISFESIIIIIYPKR